MQEEKIYSKYYEKSFSITEMEKAFSLYQQYIEKNNLVSEFEGVIDDENEEWFRELGEAEISHILYHAEMEGFTIN